MSPTGWELLRGRESGCRWPPLPPTVRGPLGMRVRRGSEEREEGDLNPEESSKKREKSIRRTRAGAKLAAA